MYIINIYIYERWKTSHKTAIFSGCEHTMFMYIINIYIYERWKTSHKTAIFSGCEHTIL